MAYVIFLRGVKCPPTARYQNEEPLNNIVDAMPKTKTSARNTKIPLEFDTYAGGYHSITYRALANAVNGFTWSLDCMLSKGRDHQMLA